MRHLISSYVEEDALTNAGFDASRNDSTELTSDVQSTSELEMGMTPRRSEGMQTQKTPYYKLQLNHMKMEGENTLYIDFVHLYQFSDDLASSISDNYYRY